MLSKPLKNWQIVQEAALKYPSVFETAEIHKWDLENITYIQMSSTSVQATEEYFDLLSMLRINQLWGSRVDLTLWR